MWLPKANINKFDIDISLILPVIFLLCFGLMMIYSTEIIPSADLVFGNFSFFSENLFYKQLFFAVTGLVLFNLASRLGFKFFDSISVPLFIVINICLIITFVLGVESKGSVRWIDLGIFRFQPTEFAKPLLILFLISFFERRQIKSVVNVVVSFLLVLPILVLTFIQPDLGSTIVLVLITFVTYFLLGLEKRYFIFISAFFLALAPLFWSLLHSYQKDRLFTFLSPQSDPTGAGYNSIQALIAVGSGRLLGLGFGRGTQSHLNFLPEKHTDFIFATLAEELGFVGAALLIVLFFILLFRLFLIAQSVREDKVKVFVLAVGSFIGIQVLINVGMNIGVLPIAGITLPLVSYGGSSLISTLFSLGLVNAARKLSKN